MGHDTYLQGMRVEVGCEERDGEICLVICGSDVFGSVLHDCLFTWSSS